MQSQVLAHLYCRSLCHAHVTKIATIQVENAARGDSAACCTPVEGFACASRVLPYGAALEEARSADADLIMVARHANPPVVKLGEAQAELFQQRQKEKELKRRQLESRRSQAVKEVCRLVQQA